VSVVKNLVRVLLIFATCSCDERQAVTGPSSGRVSIRGRVVDFGTQAAVSGAVVQFARELSPDDSRATTDSSGSYVLTVPSAGFFTVSVDGSFVGSGRVTGAAYRGDLFVAGGTCISRYGSLADARTLRPVGGATVRLGLATTTSGADGWYRIDLGCPAMNFPGGTTLMYVTHPNYAPREQVVGRGVQGVRRIDLDLERRD
jgi:hypothetical protein